MSEIPFLTYHAIEIGQFYNFNDKTWSVVCDRILKERARQEAGVELEGDRSLRDAQLDLEDSSVF